MLLSLSGSFACDWIIDAPLSSVSFEFGIQLKFTRPLRRWNSLLGRTPMLRSVPPLRK